MKNAILTLLWIMLSQISAAATPKFLILPVGPLSPLTLFVVQNFSVTYTVTNQTNITRTLTMVPVAGITQNTSGMGACANPFTLATGQSCLLNLQVIASQLPLGGIGCQESNGNFICIPEICKTESAGNNTPDPFLCSQASIENSLRVSVIPPPILTASVSALALSVNDTALNPALTGRARLINITNRSTSTATNITATPATPLPPGTTITYNNCALLPPNGICSIIITPSSTATAASGVNLSIQGDFTNTLQVRVNIVSYGSLYQGGLVFAVDDTTPITQSIGGKVAAPTDQAPAFPAGLEWSATNDQIFGIDETSTSSAPSPATSIPPPSPPVTLAACNGATDGACNTNNITSYYSALSVTSYAAGLCRASINGFSDWYLPAICEMGYAGLIPSSCGNAATPRIQNIQTGLVNTGTPGAPAGNFWSSTEYSADPSAHAWRQTFDPLNPNQDFSDSKAFPNGVRCVRVFK